MFLFYQNIITCANILQSFCLYQFLSTFDIYLNVWSYISSIHSRILSILFKTHSRPILRKLPYTVSLSKIVSFFSQKSFFKWRHLKSVYTWYFKYNFCTVTFCTYHICLLHKLYFWKNTKNYGVKWKMVTFADICKNHITYHI